MTSPECSAADTPAALKSIRGVQPRTATDPVLNVRLKEVLGCIAHDINDVSSAIDLNVELLREAICLLDMTVASIVDDTQNHSKDVTWSVNRIRQFVAAEVAAAIANQPVIFIPKDLCEEYQEARK